MPNRLEIGSVSMRTNNSSLCESDGRKAKAKAIVTLLAEPFSGGWGHATKCIVQIAISTDATEAATLFVLSRGSTGAVPMATAGAG